MYCGFKTLEITIIARLEVATDWDELSIWQWNNHVENSRGSHAFVVATQK